jgi:glycosyltransferase involved in cell wall biosynthesis
MSEKTLHVYYVVNALLPNQRAHGIQIVNTCAAVSKEEGVSLKLCTPNNSYTKETVFGKYDIEESFAHRKIWNLNPSIGTVGFYLRTFSFFFNIIIFLLFMRAYHLVRREKMVIYIRGEAVLPLFWFNYFVPVFFESHQIRGFEKLYVFALRRVSGVIVITDRLKKRMIEEYGAEPSRVSVARDAVDTDKFASATCSTELREKYDIPKDKVIVLYVGSLGKEKGVHGLLESAKLLKDGVQIVVVGGIGGQIQDLKNTFDSANISFLGQVPHDEVPSLMKCADFLIQPESGQDTYSKYFTSPMKLFEYIAASKPIIAADVPSLREVLDDSTALFFKADDAVSLADTINANYNNQELKNYISSNLKILSREVTWHKRGVNLVLFIKELVNFKKV